MTRPEDLAATILQTARSRSDICVLYATPTLAPTPAHVLDALEEAIGAPLPPEVRGFYGGADRFGLVWQEGTGTETTQQPKDWAALCDTDGEYWAEALRPSRDYSKRGGMICIPSAAEVFRKGYWLDRIVPEPQDMEIELDGETFTDREVFDELYPFDFVTSTYIAGLWNNRKRAEWRVVLAGSQGASWTDYKTLSVAEYFGQLASGLGGPHTFISTWNDEAKEIWALRKEA